MQFRKQQKQFLKKVSQKNGTQLSQSSLSVLDNDGPSTRGDDEYDPGFSDLQVRGASIFYFLLHFSLQIEYLALL